MLSRPAVKSPSGADLVLRARPKSASGWARHPLGSSPTPGRLAARDLTAVGAGRWHDTLRQVNYAGREATMRTRSPWLHLLLLLAACGLGGGKTERAANRPDPATQRTIASGAVVG